jgi:Lipase (class 3)
MIAPLRHTELLPGTLQNLFYPPGQYVYFERAADVPFQTAKTIEKAAWAADAAMLAYARYGQVRMQDAQLDDNFARAGLAYEKIGGTPTNWNAPGTQAIFAGCSDFAFMAFRGTERDDPDDLLSDANLFLAREPAPQNPGLLGHLAFIAHLWETPSLVHRGFQLALNEVWEQVQTVVTDYRRKQPHTEICFTGHSLGAALAVLAFSRFADPASSLYTFGCPRVGDAGFRDRVLANPGKGIHRYVNYNDVVAHVPTESLLYRQTPDSCCRFTADGNLEPDDGSFKGDVISLRAAVAAIPSSMMLGDLDAIPAPASLVDHSPARYCFRLWDCV